jgi:hypothetical protein
MQPQWNVLFQRLAYRHSKATVFVTVKSAEIFRGDTRNLQEPNGLLAAAAAINHPICPNR